MKRIGILTGGGDCPGINAVIASIVKTSALYGYDCIGIKYGFDGLLSPTKTINLTAEVVKDIANLGGTILKTTNHGEAAVKYAGGEEKIPSKELLSEIKTNFNNLELDYLIVIGGDGTLTMAKYLVQEGLPLVAIPKTIDNDLAHTDLSFGFSSAVETVTKALDQIKTTAESHDRVFILETMGRHSGWLALYGGFAGGADVILLPEFPFSYDEILKKINSNSKQGKDYTLIIVAEGAYEKGKMPTYQEKELKKESLLGGIGHLVANELKIRTDNVLDVRTVVLGHLQRGGSPNAQDRILAQRYGCEAVYAINAGDFGKMINLDNNIVSTVKLTDVLNEMKKVTENLEIIHDAKNLGISFG